MLAPSRIPVVMDVAVEARNRPGTATKRETRRLLTAELVMAQAGDYDLYSMKEVDCPGLVSRQTTEAILTSGDLCSLWC